MSKERVIEFLIYPLEQVYGGLPEGTVKWLIENCQQYPEAKLTKAARDVIATCKSVPYPASVMEQLNKDRMPSPAGG